MKKKVMVIIIFGLALIIFIAGIILLNKNNQIKKSSIEIIDATYTCSEALEKFYEDDKFVYYFPCVKSSSVFVKFPNNDKMLATTALNEGKVTIEELIKAGLEVHKEKK